MEDINENNIDWFEVEIGSGEINEGTTLYDGGNFRIIIEPTINQGDGFKKDPYIKYEDNKGNIRACTKDAGIIHHYKSGKKNSLGGDETKMTPKIAERINFAMDQQVNIGKYRNQNITVRDAIGLEIKAVYNISDKEYRNEYDFEVADFSNFYDRDKEPLKAKVAKYIPTKEEREKLNKDPRARAELEKQIKDEFKSNYKNVEDYLKAMDLVR